MKVISFIINYAAVHAILLPGRIPGLKNYGRTKDKATAEAGPGRTEDSNR